MIINQKSDLKTLKIYFSQYKSIFHKRGFENFILLAISIITSLSVQSIRFLHNNFISKYWNKSLNSFYYFLEYNDNFTEKMMKVTIKIVKNIINNENTKDVTIYLSIDDTIIPKEGKKFENVGKIFDHVRRKGQSFINGHSFVCLAITIPISNGAQSLTIPLGYKLHNASCTKIDLAKELVKNAMSELNEFQVILMCDSWYTNNSLLSIVKDYSNLELMGAVKKNVVLRGLEVPKKTGRRGRPRKYAERLDHRQFEYEKKGNLYVSTVKCMTNLYSEPVNVTVTTTNLQTFSSVRFFISTINTCDVKTKINNKVNEKVETTSDIKTEESVFDIYKIRWNIEVLFYQQKKFWSLESYMIRSTVGIEKYVNLIGVCYTAMILIPFISEAHKEYKFCSPQKVKYAFSEQINKELNFFSLLKLQQIKKNISNLPYLRQFKDLDDLAS